MIASTRDAVSDKKRTAKAKEETGVEAVEKKVSVRPSRPRPHRTGQPLSPRGEVGYESGSHAHISQESSSEGESRRERVGRAGEELTGPASTEADLAFLPCVPTEMRRACPTLDSNEKLTFPFLDAYLTGQEVCARLDDGAHLQGGGPRRTLRRTLVLPLRDRNHKRSLL